MFYYALNQSEYKYFYLWGIDNAYTEIGASMNNYSPGCKYILSLKEARYIKIKAQAENWDSSLKEEILKMKIIKI